MSLIALKILGFLVVLFLLCVKFLRIGKILFILFIAVFVWSIYDREGLNANFVWLCGIWLLIVLSFSADRLAIRIRKWGKNNFAHKALFSNIYKFNFLFLVGLVAYLYVREEYRDYDAYVAFGVFCILYDVYVRLKFITNTINITTGWAKNIEPNTYVLVGAVLEKFTKKQSEKKLEKLMEIAQASLDALAENGEIHKRRLGSLEYIFGEEYFNRLIAYAISLAHSSDRISAKNALSRLKEVIEIENMGVEDLFILTDCVGKYIFGTNEYYIHSVHLDKFMFCECCGGATRRTDKYEEIEWYCSDMCRDIEFKCLALSEALNPFMLESESKEEYKNRAIMQQEEFIRLFKHREHYNEKYSLQEALNDVARQYSKKISRKNITQNEQVSNAATATIASMDISKTWGENYKALSNPAAGHGDMAELLNHQTDSLNPLKKAELIGKDNASSGADRIVNGQEIQTKYCATATRSVNAAFDNGQYRYYDKNGKPMQLEVPSDQYEKAISVMEKKISNGEVPGVTNQDEAKNIIRKGSYTLQEAKNACKFFTKESLEYDAVNASIVALKTAGISFVLNTAMCYYRNGNIKEAIRQSFIVGLQTGGKTFAVYMIGAQLQRLPAFSNFMQRIININFSKGSYIGEGLAKMAGRQAGDKTISVGNAANSTLRATVITAAATIAVTSSIEVIQMARGKISSMQCVKNIFVNTGGIVGGAAGAVAGAIALSFIPVVGTFAGGLLGGMVGGMLGGGATKKVMDNLIEDDISKKYRIFYGQMARLAMLFKLSGEEMDEFSKMVDSMISGDSEFFGNEFSAKEMLPYANSILKPLVVMVVSKRPKLLPSEFNNDYIQEVIQQEVQEITEIEELKSA
ncbi:hypothetical protein LS71_001430 [Helicobacter jaachi]|uniref:Uncharacterized protein n=1 Tax=Helicobacter jaachi TaxID=1677920 RepID=A0A4U8TBW8_9HELI|nr:hypothetical protein [Helicobacter jaachi]TLD97440.1 hypothetical protein LS71_001430 [Helicobacter jaachi]